MQRDLVERAMAGDHGAFSELARASIGRLYAAARLILRDDHRAEDATQEALVAAWRDLSALRDPDRFEAWFIVSSFVPAIAMIRRGKARWAIELEIGEVDGFAPDPRSTWPTATRSSAASSASIPDQRTVLVLHYYLGLSLDEAADRCPTGTVRSRLIERPRRCVPRSTRTRVPRPRSKGGRHDVR